MAASAIMVALSVLDGHDIVYDAIHAHRPGQIRAEIEKARHQGAIAVSGGILRTGAWRRRCGRSYP